VKVGTGERIWSQSFDRELTDIFAVQDEIAQAVTDALRVRRLTNRGSPESFQRPPSPEAHRLFLLGREYMRRGIAEGEMRLALEAYRKAIALDPGYAAAWAGSSDALLWVSQSAPTGAAHEDGQREALAAAEMAIALDPDLPDGYCARAYARLIVSWDFKGAQADLDKALALSPRNTKALTLFAANLMSMGRITEAIPLLEEAANLDPLDAAHWGIVLAKAKQAAGDVGGARAVLERTRSINPNNPAVSFYLGVGSLLDGRPEESLGEFEKSPDEMWRLLGEALARHSLGQAPRARAALDLLMARFGHSAAYQVAQARAWRGEHDLAFEWLERAYREHDGGLTWIKFDPLMRTLREDSRYGAMLGRLNLPLN